MIGFFVFDIIVVVIIIIQIHIILSVQIEPTAPFHIYHNEFTEFATFYYWS